jgi:hypothetical protein
MSYHSELDAELRGLTRLPADILTMPAVPWIDMDEDDAYAWYVSLAGAIARAHELGRTTELRGPDGAPVAVIAPPPAPEPVPEGEDENRDYAEEAYWRAYCQACGDSPCTWDGRNDGFHTDTPSTAEWFAECKADGCTGTGYDEETDSISHLNPGPCPVHPGLEGLPDGFHADEPDTLQELREPE